MSAAPFPGRPGPARTSLRRGVAPVFGDRDHCCPTSRAVSITRWAKLFVSGRNITDAQKMRVRDVANAPHWSSFHIANNLGVTYTAGVTGSF
ncbi:MAG: hypothetical protein Q7S40_07215 [Opitutaceae bacterium]|nr:hypothetical protein [Opitutaceae bacterium]